MGSAVALAGAESQGQQDEKEMAVLAAWPAAKQRIPVALSPPHLVINCELFERSAAKVSRGRFCKHEHSCK